jgi:hypothetical protein
MSMNWVFEKFSINDLSWTPRYALNDIEYEEDLPIDEPDYMHEYVPEESEYEPDESLNISDESTNISDESENLDNVIITDHIMEIITTKKYRDFRHNNIRM